MNHLLYRMYCQPKVACMDSLNERLKNLSKHQLNKVQTTLAVQIHSDPHVMRWLQQQRVMLAAQAMKVQFEAKLSRELTRLLQGLGKEGPDAIARKLKDPQPLTRWVAALVTGRKRLHLEAELIERLADGVPQVRQAAREALVRLSRGNDFGPTASDLRQASASARAWKDWLRLQDPPESLREYLAMPRPEETEHPDTRLAEQLPFPHSEELAGALE
jgi:hypothetical protein